MIAGLPKRASAITKPQVADPFKIGGQGSPLPFGLVRWQISDVRQFQTPMMMDFMIGTIDIWFDQDAMNVSSYECFRQVHLVFPDPPPGMKRMGYTFDWVDCDLEKRLTHYRATITNATDPFANVPEHKRSGVRFGESLRY